jgi:Cu/Ag efflux pump CusA
MLQPLAIAVIGGILISMLLSLIVTPAIQYFLTARAHSDAVRNEVVKAAD